MEHHSVTSLMIVVSIAFLVPILLHRLKIKIVPVVVAEIIAGIIIGKSGLNVISEDPYLSLLSLLGFIFLMFLSGVEIDFDAFKPNKSNKKGEMNPFAAGSFIFVGILSLSFALSLGLQALNLFEDPFLMTIIISTISLGVVLPVLKERKLIETKYGQTILLVAVISDVATMILLAAYVMFLSESVVNILFILVLFVLVFVSYRFIKYYFDFKIFNSLSKGTIQLGTRGVFALILVFVAISETMGVESILGAFLAGIIISLLAPKKEFVHQLDSFGYGFLIPIFFVMVGVKLDLWALFSDPKILLLIPILLIVLFVSKIIPVLLLRKWLAWHQVIGSGVLLTSTLSLVVAASAIALELQLIDEKMNGALILVAVLTCFIAPILFNKLVPKLLEKQKVVSIIGANNITLPVSLDLQKDDYSVKLFGTIQNKVVPNIGDGDVQFPLIELPMLDVEHLTEEGAFDTDVIILGTSYDELNMTLAQHAQEQGIESPIVKVENPKLHEELIQKGFKVFSTLYATRTLLKATIQQPGIVRLMTQQNDSLKEIIVGNPKYDNLPLRQLPFHGDALVLQVYRNESFISPHGDTILKLGDKLLVSGSKEHLRSMKKELR
jgi:Kef-type K+ transport system membrane component KefB/Trk K+ transport system NAD-binding subunit